MPRTETVTTFDNRTGQQIAQTTVEVPVETENRDTIVAAATGALAGNRTFLGLAAPTNAQNAAQVRALTQQNQRLIRLILGQYDGTD